LAICLGGNEWAWLGRRRLQCAGRGRHREPFDRDARSDEYRLGSLTTGERGAGSQRRSASPHCVLILSQTLPSIPHDDSEAAPDRPTGKNCSDRPTTLTGSWTVAGCVSALSRNQDPNRSFGRFAVEWKVSGRDNRAGPSP